MTKAVVHKEGATEGIRVDVDSDAVLGIVFGIVFGIILDSWVLT